MSLTLPVDFVVRDNGLTTGVDKAAQAAAKAAKEAAKVQAQQLDYVAKLRQRYFAEEQRQREAEVREAARFADQLDQVKAAVSGLSVEQQRLNKLQAQAAELYNKGAISAEQYATATNAIGDRARQLAQGLQVTSNAGAEAEASTRRVGAAMGNLRSQIIDVGVQLQGGQNPLTILSQQGPQIAEALLSAEGAGAAALATLGSVASVAGVLAIAAAPLVPLWYDYAQAQEYATEAARAWNEAQDAALPLVERAKRSIDELAKLTDGSLTADEEKARLVRDYEADLKTANDALRERIALAQADVDTLAKTDARYVIAVENLRKLTAEIEANNKAAAQGAVAGALVIEYQHEQAESERALAEAKKQSAAAKKASTAASREESEALREANRLQALQLRLLLKEADAEKKRATALATARTALDKAHDAAMRSAATEEERIRLAAQAAREVAAGAAAEAQAASRSSDERKAIAVELRETLDAINQGEVADLKAAEEKKVKAAEDAAKARADAARQAVEDATKGFNDALGALQGGLADIAGVIGDAILPGIGKAVSAAVSFVQNAKESFAGLRAELNALPQQLRRLVPEIVGFYVDVVDKIIPRLIAAVPKIAESLALAVTSPEFFRAIIKLNAMIFNPVTGLKIGLSIAQGLLDAFRQGWQRFASGELIDDFKQALLWGAVSFVATIRDYFEGLVQRLKDLLSGGGGGKQKAGDVVKEVLTLGAAETKTYSDSPGPVRMSKRTSVTVEPGDWVDVARQRERLTGGGGGGSWSAALVDLAAGHIVLNDQIRRLNAQPRNSRELRGPTDARKIRGK